MAACLVGDLPTNHYRIMNVLIAYQGETAADHPGVYEAFECALQQGVVTRHASLFWRKNRTDQEWQQFWEDLCQRVSSEQIDWVLFHHFHDRSIPVGDAIIRLRNKHPHLRIATSLGDPFCRFVHRVPCSFVQVARQSDIVFLTGFGYLSEQLARAGVRNMVLMPLGYCQDRFGKSEPNRSTKQRDGIVFIGNRRLGCNPTHELFWNGLKRIRLVEKMDQRYGSRFHLYGAGWEHLRSSRGALPFNQQGTTYASAEVVFGGFPGVTYEYYTSNRHFIAMSEGAVMVDFGVKGVERLLRHQAHWLLFQSTKSLINQIDAILDGEAKDSLDMAMRGRDRVRTHFSKKSLTKAMIQIWSDFDASRCAHGRAPIPELPYVLPEFSGAGSKHLFVRHWIG